MRIHFIVHEYFEAPGAFEDWSNSIGAKNSYSRLYEGQALPQCIDDIDMLVVMGGPQSPATSALDCPHFDAQAEQAVIARAIKENKMVIGVCLGAQLIGEALGAKFESSPEREVGKFPIILNDEGCCHPLFSHFSPRIEVGHWHNDMPGLTASAKVLASSSGCPRQIVEYQPLVYGFQCHLEFTTEVVGMLIENEDFSRAGIDRYVELPERIIAHDYTHMNKILALFLDKLVARYLSVS
ncbi:glutamine amidotransferase-related protein [Pseudoalteromonas obscura]|uniref:Glutamine amidotransferase n=1 Tax=Pseudoalteromonas obscura TaxID=3048491 RepID=A0ABT7ELK6_9GAMM|nr:glutamine amidotransferase [Pseudoalteromonas sp. P94(2023)]MDK2595932.1 glutamine amidotransferase [Pseudoalteromonas sp. P94(2023)]